jgi:hypothetical protein
MALRNIGDLFEMLLHPPRFKDRSCPHGSFRSKFKIYERALVIAGPILLIFAHYCGILARTKCDVPIICKPQMDDLELRIALQKKWRAAQGETAAVA